MAALLMVAAFFGVGIIPLWTSQRAAQGHSNNISNVKQLGTAMVLYMSDLQDTYPPSNQWLTLTKAYGSGEFHCFLSKAHFTYAMNDKLSSFPATSIEEPNATALIFEMKAQVPNAHGSQRDLDPHHGGGSVYGFTDTHAKFWRPGAEPVVRWNP